MLQICLQYLSLVQIKKNTICKIFGPTIGTKQNITTSPSQNNVILEFNLKFNKFGCIPAP